MAVSPQGIGAKLKPVRSPDKIRLIGTALQNAVLVAMTGYGQEGDRQRSQEAGFNHHLVKPGDFGKVLEILATVSEKAP